MGSAVVGSAEIVVQPILASSSDDRYATGERQAIQQVKESLAADLARSLTTFLNQGDKSLVHFVPGPFAPADSEGGVEFRLHVSVMQGASDETDTASARFRDAAAGGPGAKELLAALDASVLQVALQTLNDNGVPCVGRLAGRV